MVVFEIEIQFVMVEKVVVFVFSEESICDVVVMINVVKCLVFYLGGGVINVFVWVCELVEKV